MNLIELGTPGAGKGTQAELLSKHFGIEHISSGEALRKAAEHNSEISTLLASGELLPFEMVLKVIIDKIDNSPNGFILDGTPRTVDQAEKLDQIFDQEGIVIDHVLYYYLPDDIAIQRLMKRSEHSDRSDDNPAVFQTRLDEYHHNTEPIVDYYRSQGNLIEIDARPTIEKIFATTLELLK